MSLALVLATALSLGGGGDSPPASPPCAGQARSQAQRLLAFHHGEDDRIAIDDRIEVLAAHPDPVGEADDLVALQLRGHIYRANYRLRMIFRTMGENCVLIGQEVFEDAHP